MKNRPLFFTVLIVALTFLGISTNTMAALVKWFQLPRMDQYGYDFSSETQGNNYGADSQRHPAARLGLDWPCGIQEEV